ncbi:MAG: sigma-70 family RNA polymerase sigma factor [bacterium]|nr:sigma-70 family RNA polymerase sigma factor [bacterium]
MSCRRRISRRSSSRPTRSRPPGSDSLLGVEIAERLELHRNLTEAVGALREPYRSVVYLRYFDGLGPTEIAGELDVPVKTIKTRLALALAASVSRASSVGTSMGSSPARDRPPRSRRASRSGATQGARSRSRRERRPKRHSSWSRRCCASSRSLGPKTARSVDSRSRWWTTQASPCIPTRNRTQRSSSARTRCGCGWRSGATWSHARRTRA